MAGTPRYLIERKGRFHARIVVPLHLRGIVGKTELSRPLGSDRVIAQKRLIGAAAAILDQLASAEAFFRGERPSAPAKPSLTSAAAASLHFSAGVQADSEFRDTDQRYSMGFIEDNYMEDLKRISAGSAGTDEIMLTLGSILQTAQRRGAPTHPPGSAEWRGLARRLAQAEIASLNVSIHRDQGYQDPPPPDFSDPVVSLPNPILSSTAMVRDIFDGYRIDLQRSGKGRDAKKRWSPIIEDLVAYLKHEDASRISRHDVIGWKDHLLKRFSPKTVRDTYLATARSSFSWPSIMPVSPRTHSRALRFG